MDKHGHLLLSLLREVSRFIPSARHRLPEATTTGLRHRFPKIVRLIQEKYNTGGPAPRWEAARGWRLGRRMSLYCALGVKARARDGVKDDSSEEMRLHVRR
ncbi:MAG: hypothetical protein A2V62_12785 [Nitrospirae bacterium RBG_19FT_COMBO_58_9]|nr:MAG: hypothetical protein A2V62_12785 [Nitrospirae bacterium RBG_19FT_COMBO_58_9]